MTGPRAAPDALPRRFGQFTALTVVAAVGAAAAFALTIGWHVDDPARFWLLAAFVLAGELLPIPVPRRYGLDKVVVSTTFAFVLLLSAGILPACVVCVGASVIADVSARMSPVKVIFNAAQYMLSMGAAGAVLLLVGSAPPVELTAHAVPGVLLAGLACLVVNHVLAGAGAALLAGLPVRPYLLDDLPFHVLTGGCLIALAPGVLASTQASLALIPVAFVPVLAVYFAGRQAELNAHRALHDRLTDLPNRWMLIQTAAEALGQAERAQSGVAVMILDLDDFRSINDTLGHEFGDRVLKLVAPRLAEALGPRGLLARLGGDEFAAVVEGIGDERDALQCAERLLGALQQPCELDSLLLHVGASIGVACYPQHGHTADELLRRADVALYDAKSERSRCLLYARDQDQHSIDKLALAAQLRHGIDCGQLVVHYQPKLPLNSATTLGVEALVRWNHPQLGRIGPDGFIPLAEHTGLIKAVTQRVLEVGLAQCQAWRSRGLNVRLGVNISTRELLDQDLPGTICELLARFDVPAASLQLEITESRFLSDLGSARTALDELRAMGVTIAIDDFGTGFSSLSQLQQLPVDEIKIDRSFVTHMHTDHDDAVLVRSIIELARNLSLRVTAEGVETPAIEDTLRQLGCDYAQGFHVSRPIPADECSRLLADMTQEPWRAQHEEGADGLRLAISAARARAEAQRMMPVWPNE
jgi:diguanylate cyclase (GGDEF)-like protein